MSKTHTIRFPLKTTEYDREFLDRQFRAMQHIHNVIVRHAIRLLRRLEDDKEYQAWLNEYRSLPDDKSLSHEQKSRKNALSKKMDGRRAEIKLTKPGLESYSKIRAKRFSKLVSSQQVQKECARVMSGVDKILFEDGKQLHFKRLYDLSTVGGKSNQNGARFYKDTMTVTWMGHSYPCKLKKDAASVKYREESLDHKVKYCEIQRLMFDSGWRYYVILYLEGDAPKKLTDLPLDSSGGLDPGISAMAVVGDNGMILKELAPRSAEYEKKISTLLQKMDRSRRDSNPNKYNEDGTLKKGNRDRWKYSKNYYRLRNQLRCLYRKKSAYIKQTHEMLANEILQISPNVTVEKMNYKALAKRSKKTERSDKVSQIKQKDGTIKEVHKYKRKKRYGHSINSRAPSSFLTILKRKCEQYDGIYQEIDTRSYKASQYDHVTDTCTKVPLSRREKEIGGRIVQRDLYSAFLLWNTNDTLDHADREACTAKFDQFADEHDIYIRNLKAQNVTMKQVFGF